MEEYRRQEAETSLFVASVWEEAAPSSTTRGSLRDDCPAAAAVDDGPWTTDRGRRLRTFGQANAMDLPKDRERKDSEHPLKLVGGVDRSAVALSRVVLTWTNSDSSRQNWTCGGEGEPKRSSIDGTYLLVIGYGDQQSSDDEGQRTLRYLLVHQNARKILERWRFWKIRKGPTIDRKCRRLEYDRLLASGSTSRELSTVLSFLFFSCDIQEERTSHFFLVFQHRQHLSYLVLPPLPSSVGTASRRRRHEVQESFSGSTAHRAVAVRRLRGGAVLRAAGRGLHRNQLPSGGASQPTHGLASFSVFDRDNHRWT